MDEDNYRLSYRDHPIYKKTIRIDFNYLSEKQLEFIREKSLEFICFSDSESEELGASRKAFVEVGVYNNQKQVLEKIKEILGDKIFTEEK